jgi:hypothetical protein
LRAFFFVDKCVLGGNLSTPNRTFGFHPGPTVLLQNGTSWKY